MMSKKQLDSIAMASKSRGPDYIPANPSSFPSSSSSSVPPVAVENGKVEIPVVEFLKLMQTQRETQVLPPQNYFISKSSYVGIARENFISFKCTFEIAVLVKRWLTIRLLPDSVALSSHSIKSSSAFVDGERPRIGVMEGGYFLIASQEGEFVVEMDILVPYSSVRRSGMSMWVPRAAENTISFTVGMREIEIKVDPSFVSDAVPPPLGNEKEKEKGKEVKEETTVNILFPPTNSLSVNWTVKIDEGPSETKEPPPKQKMMIIAEHNSLCSIGEGVVMLSTAFNFAISHGAASTFEIAIPQNLHIIGVEGNGIKKWEVIGGKEKMALVQLDTEVKHTYRCLRVVLDYGLEDQYNMSVLSELAMSGTSADVVIPSFKCLGEEVSREKGYLAIEARTNVEIAELKREFLQVVDTSELPQSVSKLAGNAILLAYRFLTSAYALELRVKKHDDVGVLIAACDDAHFIATMSEEGKLLHKLILRIRNSQKQYVRVRIPVAHELWSASVAGTPVKPAIDDDGMVMVQLQKVSGKQASDLNNVFIVEIVYIERDDKPMGKSGTFEVSFAQLDIPINYLFVSVNLPTGFTYTEFQGNLKEVVAFSRNPPTSQSYSSTPAYTPPRAQGRVERTASIIMRRASFDSVDMDMDMESEHLVQKEQVQLQSNGRVNRGVLPVKVEMPISGTEFKFEQLIVMGNALSVSTDYKKNTSSSYSHKRTRSWWNCCC